MVILFFIPCVPTYLHLCLSFPFPFSPSGSRPYSLISIVPSSVCLTAVPLPGSHLPVSFSARQPVAYRLAHLVSQPGSLWPVSFSARLPVAYQLALLVSQPGSLRPVSFSARQPVAYQLAHLVFQPGSLWPVSFSARQPVAYWLAHLVSHPYVIESACSFPPIYVQECSPSLYEVSPHWAQFAVVTPFRGDPISALFPFTLVVVARRHFIVVLGGLFCFISCLYYSLLC